MQLPLLWTPAPPVAPSVWRELGLWLLGEGPRPDELGPEPLEVSPEVQRVADEHRARVRATWGAL